MQQAVGDGEFDVLGPAKVPLDAAARDFDLREVLHRQRMIVWERRRLPLKQAVGEPFARLEHDSLSAGVGTDRESYAGQLRLDRPKLLLHVAVEVAWLHPADEPDEPSTVELITPRELASRVAGVKAVGA